MLCSRTQEDSILSLPQQSKDKAVAPLPNLSSAWMYIAILHLHWWKVYYRYYMFVIRTASCFMTYRTFSPQVNSPFFCHYFSSVPMLHRKLYLFFQTQEGKLQGGFQKLKYDLCSLQTCKQVLQNIYTACKSSLCLCVLWECEGPWFWFNWWYSQLILFAVSARLLRRVLHSAT